MYRDLGFLRVRGGAEDARRGARAARRARTLSGLPARSRSSAYRRGNELLNEYCVEFRRDAAVRLAAGCRLRRRAGQVDGAEAATRRA